MRSLLIALMLFSAGVFAEEADVDAPKSTDVDAPKSDTSAPMTREEKKREYLRRLQGED